MSNNIDDIVIPILREIQGKIAVLDGRTSKLDERLAKLDERTEKMDIHLGIVKSHMTGDGFTFQVQRLS